MTAQIQRQFATISGGRWGDRQVHYRRGGQGPAVLLLHQSPMSSRDLLPVMEAWREHWTVIAPDTPGYGLSDPLGVSELDIADIAEALVEFVDELGLEQFAVYGFHTGAGIATALAAQIPDRVTGVAANGYYMASDAERADIDANYLPPFLPQWDGSHLTWAWARLREQTVFFPWYRRNLAARMDMDMPDPARLQNSLVELMRSGDNYRVAYRAAFQYRGERDLAATPVATLITAADADPLSACLPAITNPSASVVVAAGGTREATLEKCRAFLSRHVPADDAPATVPTRPIDSRMWNEMVTIPGGQLRARRSTAAGGRTVIVQHDAAGSSNVVDPVSQGLVGIKSVLALDLPGHGESDNTIGETDVTVAKYQAVVQQALDALGLEQIDFYGMWGGGLVGLEMAVANPERVAHLVMSNVLFHDEGERRELQANYTPEWEPNWYGGHLLMIWHLMRDQGLFWPWFKRTREGILWQEPYIDPAMVNGRVLEVFRAPRMWRLAYQSHFAYPTDERLAAVKVPTLLAAPEWDPNYPHTKNAHLAHAHTQFLELPAPLDAWGPAFADFLN